MSSTSFSAFSANFLRFVSSRRSSEDEISLLANDSRNYEERTVSHHSSMLSMMSSAYHLQFVLPELLLFGLVEKREVSHMVHKYVA
jgi:hypothetical protein